MDEIKALEKQLNELYSKAYKEIRKEASEILEKINLNPDMSLAEKMVLMNKYDRLERLSQHASEVLNETNKLAQKMIDNEMVNVYRGSYNTEAVSLGFDVIDDTVIKKVLKAEVNPFEAINSLTDKTAIKNKMKSELLTSLLKGDSIQHIAQRLKSVSEGYLSNAIRVARTETTRVVNSAKQDICTHGRNLGFIMSKEWVATNSPRTRPEHLQANGQQVKENEPFDVGGEKLMFPGDISMGASAWNVINCRCTMKNIILGVKKS